MSTQILLKGGTLLLHDAQDHVIPQKADLLVVDGRIKCIEEEIQAPPEAMVIDCEGDIVSSGFVDTHRHLWQSQQKGLHSDQTLFDYYYSGNLASSHYTPDDVFWGVLCSALESLDGGTTTVVDHAHMNYSSQHNNEAIRATVASGIRSIFCYTAHPRVATWQPEFNIDTNVLPEWVMNGFRELVAARPFDSRGLVQLGFAMDAVFVPPALLKEAFAEARKAGVQLITSHATRVGMTNTSRSIVTSMHENGLLGSDLLLSHANQVSPEELCHIKGAGVHISSTPLSEMQMGHGYPICLNPGFLSLSSIGTDSNSICTSYMPRQMEALLQFTRARRIEENIQHRKWELNADPKVEEVYNLGTISGARAIGLGHEIGSLAVGKKADIVIFHGNSAAMISAAQRNPLAAVVLHSSVADVKFVIVDGVIRKSGFSLCPIQIPTGIRGENQATPADAKTLKWEQVAIKLNESRRTMEIRKKESMDEKMVRSVLFKSLLKMNTQDPIIE